MWGIILTQLIQICTHKMTQAPSSLFADGNAQNDDGWIKEATATKHKHTADRGCACRTRERFKNCVQREESVMRTALCYSSLRSLVFIADGRTERCSIAFSTKHNTINSQKCKWNRRIGRNCNLFSLRIICKDWRYIPNSKCIVFMFVCMCVLVTALPVMAVVFLFVSDWVRRVHVLMLPLPNGWWLR